MKLYSVFAFIFTSAVSMISIAGASRGESLATASSLPLCNFHWEKEVKEPDFFEPSIITAGQIVNLDRPVNIRLRGFEMEVTAKVEAVIEELTVYRISMMLRHGKSVTFDSAIWTGNALSLSLKAVENTGIAKGTINCVEF